MFQRISSCTSTAIWLRWLLAVRLWAQFTFGRHWQSWREEVSKEKENSALQLCTSEVIAFLVSWIFGSVIVSCYAHRVDHIAFTSDDLITIKQLLDKEKVYYKEDSPAQTGIQQLFFFDPDGNVLEVSNCAPQIGPWLNQVFILFRQLLYNDLLKFHINRRGPLQLSEKIFTTFGRNVWQTSYLSAYFIMAVFSSNHSIICYCLLCYVE